MNRTCLVLICLCCAFCARSQVVAVKTNTLYDATTTLNLGVEVACNKHLSLDISGNYNPWTFSDDKSIKHWLVQSELRYWLHERFNGHFLGVHVLYADYEVAGKTLLNVMKSDYAYDGNAYGGGISYGYQLYLSPPLEYRVCCRNRICSFRVRQSTFPGGPRSGRQLPQ